MAGLMKFWIPDSERVVQNPRNRSETVPARQVDPEWWRVPVTHGACKHVVSVDGRKIVIQGVYETNDPAEVRALIKDGSLRCDVDDAVLLGIMSLAEVQAMGYLCGRDDAKRLNGKLAAAGLPTDPAAVKKDPAVIEMEKNPKPPALPDFDRMNRDAILAWALSDDPAAEHQRQGAPIPLSTTWSRERMIERVKKTLRERGDKRL